MSARGYVWVDRACGECLFAHKSTEVNSEKRLEIRGILSASG